MPATDLSDDAEGAVRRYLVFLDDPRKLRDEAAIQRLTQAVLVADDPIDKLKALAELERAAQVDEKSVRDGFVEHARAWAEAEDVPVTAFRELGVPDDALRDAGFDVPAGPPRRARAGRASATGSESGRVRARAVPVDAIKAHVLSLDGPFVLSDVMNGVGGSPATIRKAVDELVDAGQVARLGPVPDHNGRGRAPVRYTRT
ncbi:MAG TPA: hypothetical protein VH479_05455 [Acidimicrobiales bacterium]|jgi:hypothetical protein